MRFWAFEMLLLFAVRRVGESAYVAGEKDK